MNVCHWHGGRAKRGVEAPSFKHGRYSRFLPTRLIERYEASLRDPDLLSLKNEIALIDARLAELAAMLDRGESGAHWRALRLAMKRLTDAESWEDKRTALDNLTQMIVQGGEVFQVWTDIMDAQDHRRRLVHTERKRLSDMQASITAEQAIALVYQVVGIIRKHVTDRAIMGAISDEVATLLHRADPMMPEREVLDAVPLA